MTSHNFAQMIKGPHYLAAARVTFAALLVHVLNVVVQSVVKIHLMRKVKERKRLDPNYRFDRYKGDEPLLVTADRVVGNFLEWLPVFLSVLWLYAFHVGDPSWYGWVYVLARVLYPVVAFKGGIDRRGAMPIIFISTVPQYAMLVCLGLPVAYALFVPYDDLS